MAKIYEALENAQRERKGLDNPEVPIYYPSRFLSPSKAMRSAMELDQDRESSLFHNLESLLSDMTQKIIQFIGSRKGEGTSTVIREFAKVSALKFGKSVLLLDADRNHPSQHFSFNIKPSVGWEDVIQNNKSIDQALYRIGETSLFVSPVSLASSPSMPTINSPNMDSFLGQLRQRFDLTLIDSPPATISPDGLAFSSKVDGVVLVIEAEKTRWPVTESAKERIVHSGGKILGIVFNKQKFYIPEFLYRRL